MQFLTAKTILYARIVWLLYITYSLAFDPKSLSTIGFVILLGQAMDVKFVILEDTNPMLGITSLLFALLTLTDLIPILSENLPYFESMIPIRTIIFFIIGAYSYLAKQSILSNNLIFTYSFFEIWLNFLIYNNLRDEKYYRLKKFVEDNQERIQEFEGDRVVVIED